MNFLGVKMLSLGSFRSKVRKLPKVSMNDTATTWYYCQKDFGEPIEFVNIRASAGTSHVKFCIQGDPVEKGKIMHLLHYRGEDDGFVSSRAAVFESIEQIKATYNDPNLDSSSFLGMFKKEREVRREHIILIDEDDDCDVVDLLLDGAYTGYSYEEIVMP